MLFLLNFKSSEETYYYKKSIDAIFQCRKQNIFSRINIQNRKSNFFHIISSQEYGQLSSVVR